MSITEHGTGGQTSDRPLLWHPDELAGRRQSLPDIGLGAGWHGQVDRHGVTLVAESLQRVLSSAPLSGGLTQADAWINQRIDPDEPLDAGGPAAFIDRAAAARGLPATCIGMMTAASMASLRMASTVWHGQRLSLLVTAGLTNARRAGDPIDDPTDHQTDGPIHDPRARERSIWTPIGTINTVLLLPARLADAALVDTVVTLTEAKTVALAQAGIASPLSGRIATGTGTDALAVFCPNAQPVVVTAAGKHTELGRLIARLAITALESAVAGCLRVADAASPGTAPR